MPTLGNHIHKLRKKNYASFRNSLKNNWNQEYLKYDLDATRPEAYAIISIVNFFDVFCDQFLLGGDHPQKFCRATQNQSPN